MVNDDEYALNANEFEKFTWTVIESYFKDNNGKALINHQIESFNDFILNKIEDIIQGFNTIEIYHKFCPELDAFEYEIQIEITDPVITKPMICEKNGSTKIMLPHEARQRNFSYASSLYVTLNITCEWYDKGEKHHSKKVMKNV